MNERLDGLSEGQRVCLRLVFHRKTSKEIARDLGISKDTVDQRIARAVRAIGARNREDAALLLAEAEGLVPVSRIVYEPADVAAPPDPADPEPPVIDRELAVPNQAELMEERAIYDPAFHQPPAFRMPPMGKRTQRNELSFWHTMAWIVAAIAALALGSGMLIAGLASVSQLILALRR